MIRTKNTLALRGQLIGGAVAVIGLVGSLIIAGQGHEIGGIGIALTSTTGLVSIFVLGRESQKKELASKANIRDRIKGGEPIENFEGDLAPVTPKPKPPA